MSELERQVVAGLVDAIVRGSFTDITGIFGELDAESLQEPAAIDLVTAFSAAIESAPQPTIHDVTRALATMAEGRGIPHNQMPAYHLLIDTTSDLSPMSMVRLPDAVAAARRLRESRLAAAVGQQAASAAEAISKGRSPDAVISGLEAAVEAYRAGDAGADEGIVTLEQAADSWANGRSGGTIATGLEPFDAAMDGGLPVGGVTILASEPGFGKTALYLQLVVGAMLEDPDLRVVWGMGEMSEDVLVRRLGVMGSELLEMPSVTMADAKRTPRLLVPAVGEILERLKGRLSFVKSPLTIERLENQAIRTGSRLVVIDYLQLVEVDAPTQVDGLVQVATSVRRLASRRDVAVLAVSALAKNAHRDSRVGTICYGTSRFDYDADALFFGETLTEKGAPGPAEVRLVCKKQRNGVETNIDLFFDGPHQHFLRTPPAHDDFADFTGETTAAPRVPK